MLKTKYLHRKTNTTYKDAYYNKYHKIKNIDLFSDLPKRQAIKKGWYHWLDWTPLSEFVESKIGENWDDVYSEIIKKIKKKFRYQIEGDMYICKNPIYDEDFIPRDERGRILSDRIYIDMNNILRQKTKEELLLDSKKIKRRIKLQQILENIRKEEELLIKNEMNE